MSKNSDLGVERQLEDCRAEAKRRGRTVVAEYIDNEATATDRRKPRKDYERLIAAVRAGQVRSVIYYDQDRFTRSPRELEDWIDLAEHGVELISCAGPINLGTPEGRMNAGFKANVTRYEVDQLKKRLKRSLVQRATSGKAHGRAPYGWRVDSDGKRRTGRPDVLVEEQADVIRDTAARLLRGESLRSIVADLNTRGVPATRGGPWFTQTLRAIMLRDRNAGLRVHLGEVLEDTPGDWPRIYDRDTHERVVALLTDPGRRLNEGAPRRHLLSMLAVCGKCGAPMTSNPGRPVEKATEGKRPKAPGYVCTACFGVRRVQAPVDALITELVIEFLERPDAVTLLARPGNPEEVDRQRKLAEGMEARLANAADSYGEEKLSLAQLERITAQLRPKIEAARSAIRDALPNTDFAAMAGPLAHEVWEEAPLDIRRALIETLMTVTILPSGPGKRKFDPDLIDIEWHIP